MAKIALVTGSGKKRVGWYVAKRLAERGFNIGVHYNRSEKEALDTCANITELGVEALPLQADLTDDRGVHDMFDRVKAQWGRIDVLANCAAVWQSKKLEDVTAKDVRFQFDVNTLGTFLCSQRAGLMMCQQEQGGLIVMIGDWAIERPYTDHAAYFPSKGAVPTMTRCLAVELGSRNPNVRVNCILPGPVMLPDDMPQETKERVIAATLVKREGSPEHIVKTVEFFINNDFVTGVCLPVDGGRTVFAP